MPLNPTLYESLQAIFGNVSIHKGGEPRIVEPVPDYRRPGKLQAVVLNHGEAYQLNCPFCEDHRGRLSISHAYGVPDPQTGSGNFGLFYCHRRACHKWRDCRERLQNRLRNAGYRIGQIESGPASAGSAASPSGLACLPRNTLPLHLLAPGHTAIKYVQQRGFDPNKLSMHWGVGYCLEDLSAAPPVEDRIVIPVYASTSLQTQPDLAGWQARSIDADASTLRYLSSAGLPTQDLLYGLPQAIATNGPIILCEGVTDVWRVGPGAVATFGKKCRLSIRQRRLLQSHCAGRPVVVLYDADATDTAQQLAKHLSQYGIQTSVASLPSGCGDPGEARQKDLWESISQSLCMPRLRPAKVRVLLEAPDSRAWNVSALKAPIAVQYIVHPQSSQLEYAVLRSLADGTTVHAGREALPALEHLPGCQVHHDALAALCDERRAGLSTGAHFDDLRTMSRLIGKEAPATERPASPLAASSLLACTEARWRNLQQDIADLGLDFVYRQIELPIIPVAAAMMTNGVGVDLELLERKQELYAKRWRKLRKRLKETAGREVDVDSHEQLAALLFDALGLQPPFDERSTDKCALRTLAGQHPIAGLIRDCRRAKNLLDNAQLIRKCVDPARGRVSCRMDPLGTDTGRFTTETPNLHGTPRALREVFVAADGHVLIEADFSQIELRVLAHFTQDASLLGAFSGMEVDLHRRTAGVIHNVSAADVTDAQRKIGKRVNFAIIYGNTPYGLSRELGISLIEAEEFIERYLEAYPGVRDWVKATQAACTREGLARTLYGRLRHLPRLGSDNEAERAKGLRQAVNTVVQGTAADINKLALIRLHRKLPPDWRMLLTVHDSVIVEVPQRKAAKAKKLVKQILEERPPEFTVNIVADVTVGPCWSK